MEGESTGFRTIREGRAEAITKGPPRHENLTPEGGGVRVEVGEGAIREEKRAGILSEGRIGGTDPMEGKKAIGVVARFNKGTDSAHA